MTYLPPSRMRSSPSGTALEWPAASMTTSTPRPPVRSQDSLLPLLRGGSVQVEGLVHSEAPAQSQPLLGGTDHKDGGRSTQGSEGRRREPHGPAPWTRTVSPRCSRLRSTAANPVKRPQPPPMT